MAVGIFGGQSHLAWTAHGEAFNVASRIEQMTRVLHEELLIGKNTVECLPRDWFQSKGHHLVKGLTNPLELFTLAVDALILREQLRTKRQGSESAKAKKGRSFANRPTKS
jgi:class 3 adenylate cyclase